MADESITKTVVQNEIRQTGFDKALKETEELNKALMKTLGYLEDIGTMMGLLSDTVKHVGTAINSLNNVGKTTKTPTTIETNSKGLVKRYTHDADYQLSPDEKEMLNVNRGYVRSLNKLMQAQAKLVRAQTDRADQIVADNEFWKDVRKTMLRQKDEGNQRKIELNAVRQERNETERRKQEMRERNEDIDRALKEEQLRRKRYLNDHPENSPYSQRGRYIAGSTLRGFGGAISSMGTPGRILGSVADTVGSFVINPLLGIGTAVKHAAEAVTLFTKAAVAASSEIEALKTNLEIVFSDRSQAQSMFHEISQYAVKSPFGVEQTTEMAVLLRQSGVYATDLMDTLRMIGDTAGGNADKMKRIANNYAQIVSIGKASMLDMRQFAYAGIPIYKAVSQELGVSQEQLRKMISEGKVTSDIIEKVFKDLTGINGIFENATAKGAQTFKARIQNLKDAKQLFFATVGDNFLKKGIQEKYNGSGVVTSVVDALEDFFSKSELSQNIRNINKNVASIEQYNNRIAFLREGLNQAKESGDKEKIKLFEEALARETARRTISEEKATYLASYNAKQGLLDSIPDEYKHYSLKELKSLKDKYRYEQIGSYIDISTEIGKQFGLKGQASLTPGVMSFRGWTSQADREKLAFLKPWLKERSKEIDDVINILKAIEGFEEEEIQAHREDLVKQGQEGSYTYVDKSASRKSSLLNEISSLTIALSETEEAKEKEKEDQRKRWDDALKALRSIDYAVSEIGIVDYSKLSAQELYDISKRGGFRTDSERITAYDEKYLKLPDSEKTKLKNDLKKDFNHLYDEMIKISAFQSTSGMYSVKKNLLSWGAKGDDESWFEDFSNVFESFTSVIKNSALDEKEKDKWNTLLGLATLVLSTADTKGLDPSALDKDKGKAKEAPINYPLWERIESSSLGIPLDALFTDASTKKAVDLFEDFLSPRNKSTKVFQAAGSVTGMQQMLKYYGVGEKNGHIYQIDWQETVKGVEDFALKLRSSTKIIDAWQAGLKEERDAVEKLVFSDIFQNETQNVTDLSIGSNTSDKPFYLNELGDLSTKVAVNAFGEQLKTISGKEVTLNADDELVLKEDESVKVSEDQLIVTGNIYEMLKEYLKKLDEQDRNAATAKANADTLSSMRQEVTAAAFKESLLDYWSVSNDPDMANKISDLNEVLKHNTKFLDQLAESYTESVKLNLSNGNQDSPYYKAGNYDTVFDSAMTGDEYAITILRDVFKEIAEAGDELAHSDLFLILLDLINRQDSINSTWDLATLDKEKLDKNSESWKTDHTYSFEKKMVSNLGYKTEGLFESEEGLKIFDEKKELIALGNIRKALHDLSDDFKDAAINTVTDGWVKSFEAVGETLGNVINGSQTMGDMWDNVGDALANTTAALLKQIGPAMVNCGLQIAAAGAMEHNWGFIFGGLALAAAGGLTSGLASFADKKADDSGKKEDYDKAQDLKDQLAELLEQARKDALYYEMNLRHKKAIGLNKEFSIKSVDDAIISPEGNIVTTHPEDYLIATKTPGALLNGNSRQPNITFKVINNSPDVVVRQERRQNALGETELIAIVEGVVTEYIAGPKGDEAFGARQARGAGNMSIM